MPGWLPDCFRAEPKRFSAYHCREEIRTLGTKRINSFPDSQTKSCWQGRQMDKGVQIQDDVQLFPVSAGLRL